MTNQDFQAIFDQHKDSVFRFAWRMTNSPAKAEDIAQDVFLALLQSRTRFDPERGPLRPYLLGMARNLVLKRWREESRWEDLEEERWSVQPEYFERSETAEIVAAAVRALPPLQREVLILVQYEGLTLEEVARTVESEVGTVKSRLYRARENLRRMLAPLKPAKGVRSNHGTTR